MEKFGINSGSRLVPEKCAQAKPQELTNTCWSLATAGVLPEYPNAFDTTLLPQSQRPRPQQVMQDPVMASFAIASQELMRRPDAFKPQEIKVRTRLLT